MVMGRPREFDVDRALDRALEVFWRNGYEGTSIADLTAAMNINPPSLYAAFGNKEGLFRKALDRYIVQRALFWEEALRMPTMRGAIERLLHGGADFLTEKSNPHGCMIVRSAMSCSESAETIQQELIARRAEGEAKLRERLQQAKQNGEMPPDLEPADYARYLMTMLEGMSVRAASGGTRKELRKIADMALRSWPA